MPQKKLHPRTEILNQKDKNSSKLARLQAIRWLSKKFPQAFDNSQRIRPLKVGIMNDILQYVDEAADNGISKSKLREAVVVYTRRVDYLICLKAREMRIDLEGNPTTQVTEEEAENAASKVRKRVEKSARTARKLLAGRIPSYYQRSDKKALEAAATSSSDHSSAHDENKGFPYPERPPAYSSQHTTPATKPAASVMVKHKTVRQYDPDAVARLKAKLGLSKKNKEGEKEGEAVE